MEVVRGTDLSYEIVVAISEVRAAVSQSLAAKSGSISAAGVAETRAQSSSSLSSLSYPNITQTSLFLPSSASSSFSPSSSLSSSFSPSPSLSSFSSSQSSKPTSSTLSSVSSAPTSRNNPESHNSDQNIIAIGVMIPTVVIGIILAGLWALRKSTWRKRSTVIEGQLARPPEEIQPYLQQKAELEDEPRRKHEVEAQERRYELDGNELFELQDRHSENEAI